MSEKTYYKVLPGKKITGRYKIYAAGEIFSNLEAIGDMDSAVKKKIVKKVESEVKPEEKKDKK